MLLNPFTTRILSKKKEDSLFVFVEQLSAKMRSNKSNKIKENISKLWDFCQQA
jgi:hypothetical protein